MKAKVQWAGDAPRRLADEVDGWAVARPDVSGVLAAAASKTVAVLSYIRDSSRSQILLAYPKAALPGESYRVSAEMLSPKMHMRVRAALAKLHKIENATN